MKTKNNNKLIAISVFLASVFPLYGFSTTMSQAVQTALNNLPDIKIDVAKTNASAQTIKEAKAAYLPTINGNAGYGREHAVNSAGNLDNAAVAPIVPAGTDPFAANSATLNRGEFGLNLTENVFDGFNTTYEVKRTKAETASLAYQVYGTANDMALNVIKQYINVVLQRKLVALSEQNVRTHRSIAGTISEREKAGIAGNSELSQADTRIALAKSNMITQESNLDDAKTEYQRYVGIKPANLVAPKTPHYPAIPKTENQALQIALKEHPILRVANADIDASIAQHNESKYTQYPKVDLILEMNDNDNVQGFEGPQDNYLAIARLNYNFFAGGANLAKQRQTAFDTQQAIAIRNRAILQTEEAVRLAWTAMQNEQRRIAILNSYRSHAANTLSAYREEFKLNKRTLLDLLDSQNEVYEANVSYQKARADELFARYRLLNAMGTLIQYLHTTVIGGNIKHYRVDKTVKYKAVIVSDATSPAKIQPEKIQSVKVASLSKINNRAKIQNGSKSVLISKADPQPAAIAPAAIAPAATATKAAAKTSVTTASNSERTEGYVIQLMAAPNKSTVNRFIARHDLNGQTVIHEAQVNGKTWYELLYGNFSSESAAQSAMAELPSNLSNAKPWIRNMA